VFRGWSLARRSGLLTKGKLVLEHWLKELLDAGVFWTPDETLEPEDEAFLFRCSYGIHIIDLSKT